VERLLRDLNHPYARARAVYDVTFENVQVGAHSHLSAWRIISCPGARTANLSELRSVVDLWRR